MNARNLPLITSMIWGGFSGFGGLDYGGSHWVANGPGGSGVNLNETPSQAKLKKQRNGGGTRRQRAKRKTNAPNGMQSPRRKKR